jgi:hypothetical protein
MRWKQSQHRKAMKERFGPKHLRRRALLEKFPENMVKIEFCHSIYEIQIYHDRKYDNDTDHGCNDDYEDNPGTFRSEWDYQQIQTLARDYYGINCDDILEYYNYQTKEWNKFPKDIDNNATEIIKLYKGKGNRSMPLRIPSEYDDGHVSDDDEEMVQVSKGQATDNVEGKAIRLIIRRLVEMLHRDNYIRVSSTSIGRNVNANVSVNVNAMTENDDHNVDDDANMNRNDDDDEMIIIPTKLWIVQQAELDPFLASLLMSRPGALQHIVQCIHWDRVWNSYTSTAMTNNNNNTNNNATAE